LAIDPIDITAPENGCLLVGLALPTPEVYLQFSVL
jgi:hypothetical protein